MQCEWRCPKPISFEKWQLKQLSLILECSEAEVEKNNHHHPFACALSEVAADLAKMNYQSNDYAYSFVLRNLKKAISKMKKTDCFCLETKDNSEITSLEIKETIEALLEDMHSDSVYVVPEFLHNLFNCVFAGDFTPIEAMLKLDWIFYYKRKYNRNNKKFLLQFLFSLCIIEKKKFFSEEEMEDVLIFKNCKEDVSNIEMLNYFDLTLDDIRSFIGKYFFHPYWGRKEFNHCFLLMLFLKIPEHINKSTMGVYLRYYKNNGIGLICKNQDTSEIEMIKFALDLFLED